MPKPPRQAVARFLLLAALAATAPRSFAEDKPAETVEPEAKFGARGPTTGDLGEGEIKIPQGYVYFNKAESQKLAAEDHSQITGQERGAVAPTSKGHWMCWFAFENIGYVKDDEKDSIDADSILDSYKENAKRRNERNPGDPAWNVVGWREKPHYNSATHNLEWCMEFTVGGQPLLNHKIKLLGRRGVMDATLACDPADLDKSLADTRSLLAGYAFKNGGKYEEWTTGDKVAAVGLTGLVAGGAIAAAAKTGLLGKLIKPILVGLAALGGGIVKFWNKITGRNK